SKGRFSFRRPDHLEWEVLSPAKSKMVFDQGKVEIYEGEKLKSSFKSGSVDQRALGAIQHLKAWLTLDRDFIAKNYTVSELSKNTFLFTPQGESRPFKSIKVLVGKNAHIERLELT